MPHPADEVSVVANFIARRAHEGELLSLLHGLLAPTRAEEGCLRYELNQEIDNPRSFILTERFHNEAAYNAHLTSKHVKRFVDSSADIVESRTVRLNRELLPPSERSESDVGADASRVVIAQFTATPGREEELSVVLQSLVGPTRAEPGCLRYELGQDVHDPATFSVVEMYTDQQAFAAHRNQPYIQRLLAALPELAISQYIGVYRQVPL